MQTRALKTLVEIDNLGSFVAAAGQLNMTLSAVSMQMKALESDLGAALFDRTVRPPRLTPLGRTICTKAKTLLALETELRAACEPGDRLAGRYRIGFVPTASVRLMPRFLLNAERLAPAAEFDIITGLSDNLEEDVLNGTLDFAVVTASPDREGDLANIVLREEPLAFAAPAGSASHDLAALAEAMPFFHFMPSTGIGKLIADRMKPFLRGKRREIVLDSVEAIMECVNGGLGFTLLPVPDIERYATPGTQVFRGGAEQLSRRIALVSAGSRHPEQAALISALLSDAP